MENQKFIMRDKSGNYAMGIATYTSNFHEAQIFEGNPEDYKQFENEIILLDSERGLELIAREIESLDNRIPNEEFKLAKLKEGRARFYQGSEKLREYITRYNQKVHPIIGISEFTKQQIIEDLTSK